MSRLIATIGLQGSGKSTWAIQYCKDNPHTVRVNKDSLRFMAYGEPYRPEWEPFICDMRDEVIRLALHKGYDVIVDDTNFKEEHIKRLEEIAVEHDIELEIKDFTNVPLEVCLERNKQRPHPVPEEAIHRMHERYIINDDLSYIRQKKFYGNPRRG